MEGSALLIGMVLAAGYGRRLRPYTDDVPKTLVPVDGDTTILDIALANMAKVGITEVVVVIGYKAEAVEARKAELEAKHGVELTLVFNDKAEIWNNAYSLWCAKDHLAREVLLVNGDTVHPVGVEETLIAARGTGQLLLALDVTKKLGEEEMKVLVAEDGHLARITKLMDADTAYGEYIGATFIEPAAAEVLIDSLQATFERDPDLYYEDGYQEMVNRGEKVTVVPLPASTSWVEVDNHDDLAKAREIACRY